MTFFFTAGQSSGSDGSPYGTSSSSSGTSNLPLFIGVPAGGVFVLVIVAVILLQNRRRCNANRSALKRHRLPIPTQEREAYYNYHHSPATTNTGGGTTATSGSNNVVNMHVNSLQLSREKMPKTPAPSLDFGSDISSVSHSHTQQLQQMPSQPQMHFVNPHMTYNY